MEMNWNWMRNISFRKKLTMIFTIVCTISTCAAGALYYQFAAREIVNNFTANAESLVNQLENLLDARLEAVDRRAFAALTNPTFTRPFGDYLNAPDLKKEVAIAGEAANWLRDISQAEPLIHSTLLYTEQGSWDDYIRTRNWDFSMKDSEFWDCLGEMDAAPIQWMPVMEDAIFRSGDSVIPYIRRFTTESYRKSPAYLIIQLDQGNLMDELFGDIRLGEIVITDQEGRYIAGTIEMSGDGLCLLAQINQMQGSRHYTCDMEYEGEDYLLSKGVVKMNGWHIFILKSKNELLDNMKDIRTLILGLTLAMIFVSMLIVAFFSRQLTFSLQRLALQMNRMRNGEMEARYYYPYQDEVGSLAKSFNFMADEIEKAMKKQEEYIAVLREERDFAEQVQKQKRKAELCALQAQINPHFLYNTLNTITWMASDQGVDEIRMLSNSLGKFFRISLSRGAETISVRDEVEHVKSYLTIQKIRYAEKLDYEIAIPETFGNYRVLKLMLQPLVENSIYHGIKEKEGKSRITISAQLEEEERKTPCLRFCVEDNGVGISQGKLNAMNDSLSRGDIESREGYGIFNVNERIKLYYGVEYGLYYESREGEWTRAMFTVPAAPG